MKHAAQAVLLAISFSKPDVGSGFARGKGGGEHHASIRDADGRLLPVAVE